MKFMKLGTRPDTFYTEEATRAVISDLPSDLTIQINNVVYRLHKYALVPKCGLLQGLLAEDQSSDKATLELHDIPGGEDAFELCAKFCYGIAINLSAHNFVAVLCAAKFLRMNEAVESGNLVMKLETFFTSCVLEGWKDCVVTLQNAERVYEWSENLGIVRRCIESIVDKILLPTSKVTWSYTYTRQGYEKKNHQSAPKDWWTEDISFLDIDIFRRIITAIKSSNRIQPQLIGEALHVYACRCLLNIAENGANEGSTSSSANLNAVKGNSSERKHRILETIVGLIPSDEGSVSIKFLMRLLRVAYVLGASHVTRAELLRLSGLQLEEATIDDLLILRTQSSDDEQEYSYDVDTIKMVLESFLRQWKRKTSASGNRSSSLRSMHRVWKLIDSYLQAIARDVHITSDKMVALIETLPGIARPEHDDLYKAIDVYLKEHPGLSKADRKQLCKALDCQKLSPEVRAHAVRNERLPLRTVVQVLFFDQEQSKTRSDSRHASTMLDDGLTSSSTTHDKSSEPGTSRIHRSVTNKAAELRQEPSFKIREVEGTETEITIEELGVSGFCLNPHHVMRKSKGKDQ